MRVILKVAEVRVRPIRSPEAGERKRREKRGGAEERRSEHDLNKIRKRVQKTNASYLDPRIRGLVDSRGGVSEQLPQGGRE